MYNCVFCSSADDAMANNCSGFEVMLRAKGLIDYRLVNVSLAEVKRIDLIG